jgi:hypothetical protein
MIAAMYAMRLLSRKAFMLASMGFPALCAASPVVLDSISVSSTEPTPTYSNTSITPGNRYLLKASGTYSYSDNTATFADAGYLTFDSWATIRTDVGIRATTLPGSYLSNEPGVGAGTLLVDFGAGPEVVDWGDYAPTHIYRFEFTAASDVLGFVIGDWWGDWDGGDCEFQACQFDNDGGLSVTVSEITAVSAPATVWLVAPVLGWIWSIWKRGRQGLGFGD